MTRERVRMQLNSSEVSFYTDLESFRILFAWIYSVNELIICNTASNNTNVFL